MLSFFTTLTLFFKSKVTNKILKNNNCTDLGSNTINHAYLNIK